MTNSKKLEHRLKHIESLFEKGKISSNQFDILDALARAEAGALRFDDALEDFEPKKAPAFQW